MATKVQFSALAPVSIPQRSSSKLSLSHAKACLENAACFFSLISLLELADCFSEVGSLRRGDVVHVVKESHALRHPRI